MTSFWRRLMGRRDEASERRAERQSVETPAARRFASEGVEGVAADEVVEERLGGANPQRLVDDEFKP